MNKLIFLLSLSGFFNTLAFSQIPVREAVGVVKRVGCVQLPADGISVREAVGVVTHVEGLVTVSQDDTLGNAFKGKVILQNARVATTATASTTIRLNNCCVIVLKPNQAVTVDYRRECKAILAFIQPSGVGGVAGAGGASGIGSAVTPQILGNALILGSGIFTDIGFTRAIFRSRSNSALQKLSGS